MTATIEEQSRTFIVERTGLPAETVDVVLAAISEFWTTRCPDIAFAAQALVDAAWERN